ncbi:hypothetical protein GW17_00036904, partial [Ensete ventricosum]
SLRLANRSAGYSSSNAPEKLQYITRRAASPSTSSSTASRTSYHASSPGARKSRFGGAGVGTASDGVFRAIASSGARRSDVWGHHL